ncbi:MAG: XTP/dITP diphosphatase [Eubacteriaceae bacterium]|nr:XTP/dITP diphosphatase [Eubacteriaceae bacterium]
MERKTIIAATRNKHKIVEIDAITKKFGMDIISRDEAGLPKDEVEEDGTTFEENSYKKAYEIMKISNRITIADDSGICVDYLDGAPGIYSARYAGEECDDAANRLKMLAELEGVPAEKRGAKYVCVITMVFPDGETLVARGECRGHIGFEEIGTNGFGYDSIFIPEGYDITFAEFEPEDKNKISHRAEALIKLEELLKERK